MRPRVGISACLLGDVVRYDAGDTRDALLADVLGRQVDWVKVCPEVEMGMGVPREAILLTRTPGGMRAVGAESTSDYTESMRAYARRKVEELAALGLSGYVLKSRSPSCGIGDTKVYEGGAMVSEAGTGLFAEALRTRFPGMPIEDERRLADPERRRRFLESIAAHAAEHRDA